MVGTKSRIIYASTDVLVSDSPAASPQDDTYSLKRLDRVQQTSVSISNNFLNKKHIGFDDYLFDVNIMPPSVTCDIEYINQNNSNELILGLNASGYGIYSGLERTGTDKNIFFLFDTGSDLRDLTGISDFNNQIQVMGLGNAFVTNYSCSAEVGGLPTSSVSLVASNVTFHNYTYPLKPDNRTIPSLISGQVTDYKYLIASDNFESQNYITNVANDLDFIRYGDIILEVFSPTQELAGADVYLGGNTFASGRIQNYDIQIPFSRRDLVGFGSNYPYDRKLMYPEEGSISMKVIFEAFHTGNQTGVIFQDKPYNFTIRLKDCSDYNTDKLIYKITGAQLASQSMSVNIGNTVEFDGTFNFPITQTGGFSIDGECRFI